MSNSTLSSGARFRFARENLVARAGRPCFRINSRASRPCHSPSATIGAGFTWLGLVLACSAAAAGQATLDLKDGDRVAFVGGTFFEREAQYGYIETALVTRFPGCKIVFRNLGCSGDTVKADARSLCAGWEDFGPSDQGFNRLKSLVKEIKPTVVFVAYGMTESFGGASRLPDFIAGYERSLDMLAESAGGSPRFVLISPNAHEDLGRPLPDPSSHNKDLELYSSAIRALAAKRDYRFVDLLHVQPEQGERSLTDDGIHLTEFGYAKCAREIETGLGYAPRLFEFAVKADGNVAPSSGLKVTEAKSLPHGGLSFTANYELLPLPSADRRAGAPLSLRVTGLPAGTYVLRAGERVVATGTAEEWGAGREHAGDDKTAEFSEDPAMAQAVEVRRLIVAKNAEFLNYWRPENDTYILGYRKREQGRNAVELPQFKPLTEEKDAAIAAKSVPQPVSYRIERR